MKELVVVVAGAVFVTATAQGNPTGKNPYQPMAVHGTIEGAKEEATRLYTLYEKQEKLLMLADAQKANPQSIPAPKLATVHAEAWKAGQDAARLSLMGEPAGEDLQKRFYLIQEEARKLCFLYRETPRGMQQVQKILQQLKGQLPALQKFLRQAEAAASKGKLELFEKQMEAKGVQLRTLCVYLNNQEEGPYWPPFAVVLRNGVTPLNESRQEKFYAIARVAIQEHLSPANNFADETDRIRAQIAATGKATLGGGVEGDVAESFSYVVTLWGYASAGISRAIALEWAFTNQPTVKVSPTTAQLRDQATQALVSLIEAAASSPPSTDFSELYSRLLKQVSIASRRCSAELDFVAMCRPKLDQLAATAPNFPTTLAAYSVATRESLQWRRQFAVQHAEFLSQGFSSARKIMNSQRAANPAATARFGTALAGSNVFASNSFEAPTNWMVQETASSLIDAPVIAEAVIRLNPTSRTEVTTLKGHNYGNILVPELADTHVEDLRTSLVIDDSHGPLSIEAAGAVSSAELGDYVLVGGLIRDVHLESLVTRVATLPDVVYMMVPLGEAPEIARLSVPRKLICWRLNIEPAWVQNEYFTARIIAPKN